jgi:UDP-N-acetylmuramoyl-tripeptide--D-alanyl-D-alanine ligase
MGKVKITIEDLFNISSTVIYNPDAYKTVSVVEIDSRRVKKGCLFVAIKGEKLDGHNFIQEAIKKGASAVMIDSGKLKKFDSLNIPVITVNDTIKAYAELAKIWRDKLNAVVIGITGSNGKTTVKEMTASLLSEKFNVVSTQANNNNHIGVPLTILSADEKCQVLVLEQGTNHFGEIPYSAKISRPDFSLITNIGDSHVEFLKDRNGVYKEKAALFEETNKRVGKVFINTDDPIISAKAKNFKNKVTYGFKGKVNVKGKMIGFMEDGRTRISITGKGKTVNAVLPVYGEVNAKNFLAASAIALELGISPKQIISAVQKIKSVHGRLEVKKFKQAFIIDDTYNASPSSIESAVALVEKVKSFKNKIVVLGDIFELGKKSAALHKDLAKLFKPNKYLIVLTVGDMMKHLHKALRVNKIKSIHFHLREALSLYLQYEEIENSVILVKGSRGMKMEEFVNILENRFE